jgi:hypothetical protein
MLASRSDPVHSSRRRAWVASLGLPILWLAAGLLGGPAVPGPALGATPIGAEFQVNSYTTNSQYTRSVASDADGDFVVVWQSYGSAGGDNDDTSIQGQRYDGGQVCHDGNWDWAEFCGRDAWLVTGRAEMNHDCRVDLVDEKLLIDEWGTVGPNLSGDLDGNGSVGPSELVMFKSTYALSVSPCTRGGMLPDACEGTLALSFSDDPETIVSTTTQTPGSGVVYVVVDGWSDPEVLEFGVESSSNVEMYSFTLDENIEDTSTQHCDACGGDDEQHRSAPYFTPKGLQWPSGPVLFGSLDYDVLDSNPAWIKLVPNSWCSGHSRIRWAKAAGNRSINFETLLNVGINGPAPEGKSTCANPVPAFDPKMSWVLSGILMASAVAVLGHRRRSRLRLPRTRTPR